ncbi:MAG: hypothetical protein OEY19_05540 [Gammaproteobacteria bacterium]|nr:hypothetical protein [Gammaproteobacteria bacterium]MDH5629718.1 hypothetical protein [Gammaproteobacteria bacterium]
MKIFVISGILILLLISGVSSVASAKTVVLVTNSNNAEIELTTDSIRKSIKELIPDASLIAMDKMTDDVQPELVISIGNSALEIAKDKFPGKLTVGCLLLNSESFKVNSNINGLFLQHSIESQLLWHKKILPAVRNIGILYSPEHNNELISAFEKAASRINLNIAKIPVNSAQDLPAALKAIKRNSESILAIPDPVVYSGKTAKGVLLFSFRNKIPLVGLSKFWVKAGALYSLDWDYQHLGKECASEASKLLMSKQGGSVKNHTANGDIYHINNRTAEAMNLTLAKALIKGAANVY